MKVLKVNVGLPDTVDEQTIVQIARLVGEIVSILPQESKFYMETKYHESRSVDEVFRDMTKGQDNA
jgi:hypothetical protein